MGTAVAAAPIRAVATSTGALLVVRGVLLLVRLGIPMLSAWARKRLPPPTVVLAFTVSQDHDGRVPGMRALPGHFSGWLCVENKKLFNAYVGSVRLRVVCAALGNSSGRVATSTLPIGVVLDENRVIVELFLPVNPIMHEQWRSKKDNETLTGQLRIESVEIGAPWEEPDFRDFAHDEPAPILVVKNP